MIDALIFVGPALAICLVIASIHVYLGMHVLAREIMSRLQALNSTP